MTPRTSQPLTQPAQHILCRFCRAPGAVVDGKPICSTCLPLWREASKAAADAVIAHLHGLTDDEAADAA